MALDLKLAEDGLTEQPRPLADEDTFDCTHGSLHKKDCAYICDLCGQPMMIWTDPLADSRSTDFQPAGGCEICANAPTDPPEFKPFFDESAEDV